MRARASAANFAMVAGTPATKNTASPGCRPFGRSAKYGSTTAGTSPSGRRWRSKARIASVALRAEVLRDRPGAALLAVPPEDVPQAGLPLALGPAVHAIAERAIAAAGRRDRPDPRVAVGLDQPGKHLELRAPERVGDIGDQERIAQIGLVGPEGAHRRPVRDARERQRRDGPVGELGEQPLHHRLDRREHVLLGGERHLEIELVELAGAAVGARVLVAKAGRDLEVAVEAGHHQQLLVLLRRLRQGVELAGMQAGRHQEVAGTLGRARGQDRRLELDEALCLHAPADARDHARAQQDVLLHRLAPQVEEAKAQAGVLRIVALGVDLERQLLRRGLDDQGVGDHLDLAGRQVGVDRIGAARDQVAGHGEHALQAHVLRVRKERMLGLKHDLGDAVVVAQIDEQQLPVIALAVHPAGQAHRLADLVGAQLAAVVGAIGMHGWPLVASSRRTWTMGDCRGRKGHRSRSGVKPATAAFAERGTKAVAPACGSGSGRTDSWNVRPTASSLRGAT